MRFADQAYHLGMSRRDSIPAVPTASENALVRRDPEEEEDDDEEEEEQRGDDEEGDEDETEGYSE